MNLTGACMKIFSQIFSYNWRRIKKQHFYGYRPKSSDFIQKSVINLNRKYFFLLLPLVCGKNNRLNIYPSFFKGQKEIALKMI